MPDEVRPTAAGDGTRDGVSFVVPVRDGARWIGRVLEGILAEDDGRPFEVVVVDDGSRDRGPELVAAVAARDPRVRVLDGPRRGAAAAINAGIAAARYPLVAQVDQDVLLEPGWLAALAGELRDPAVAAAQGYYATDRRGSLWARAAGYDLELRYAGIRGRDVDHVCTGNSVYRRRALEEVGLFDESFGYAYDNRMSYRLRDAGWRLVFNRRARSRHAWRDGVLGYLRQQYGQGYGRLDLVLRHPGRVAGDMVSGATMVLHAPLMLAAVVAMLGGGVAMLAGWPARPVLLAAVGVVGLLTTERLVAAIRASRLVGDPAALFMVPAHLLRDLAWGWAIVVWGWRRLLRRPASPRHSMG